jgi:hypothetical protein
MLTVRFDCKVCLKPGALECEPPDNDLAQRMFDAVFPALCHERCSDWRNKNVYAREDIAALADLYARSTKDVRPKVQERLHKVMLIWMGVNVDYLKLRPFDVSGIESEVLSKPREAAFIIKRESQALVSAKENKPKPEPATEFWQPDP